MEESIVVERNQLRRRYRLVKLLKKLKEVKQIANSIELAEKLDNTPHLGNIDAFEDALKEAMVEPVKEAIRSKL
jgi:hypothetical protein